LSRGQSVLESTIAVALLLVALGALTAALQMQAVHARPDTVRLIADSALSDAETELFAATAYDPGALAAVTGTAWSVTPPVPPSPAPTGAAGPIALTSRVEPYGSSRVVRIHAVAGPAADDATFSLRYAAPPPGALITASTPPP
jgi:hypothetical protein